LGHFRAQRALERRDLDAARDELVAARGLAQENSPDRRATLLAQGGGKAHSVLG
jgi:hypothetical protein